MPRRGASASALLVAAALPAAARAACNLSAAWTLTFAYSGAFQLASLPPDFALACGEAETSVAVDARLWGAGGAASCTLINWPPPSPSAIGGGGGFVRASAYLPRGSNDSGGGNASEQLLLRVIVGRGGLNAKVATGADEVGAGGGANTKSGQANINPGGGGGRSALQVSYNGGASFEEVVTAGGGGGAYLYGNYYDGFYYPYGGGGGFPQGQSGAVSATPLSANPPLGSRAVAPYGSWASGGSSMSAGFCTGLAADGGEFLVGGICTASASPNFGPGGGGGYYGGGAAPEKGKSAGGGGSGFVDTSIFNFSLVTAEDAVLNASGGRSDPFFAGGIASGAVAPCNGASVAAGNGAVVVQLACGCILRPSSSPSPSVTASASASPSVSPTTSLTSTPSLSPTSSVGAAAVAVAAAVQAQALQSLIVTASLSAVFSALCLLACIAAVLRRRHLAAKEERLRRAQVVAELAGPTPARPVIYQINMIGSRSAGAPLGPGDAPTPVDEGAATAVAASFAVLGRGRQQSARRAPRAGLEDWTGRSR